MIIDAWNWEGHWAALLKEKKMIQTESQSIIEMLRADLRALRADYAALIAAREAVARAEEREACAALADELADRVTDPRYIVAGELRSGSGFEARAIAAAIRARGKEKSDV